MWDRIVRGRSYLNAVTLGGAIAAGDQTWTNVGDVTFHAGSILKSGSTNTDTLILRANDTAFITFTTAATDECELEAITMKGTWLADGTVTMPAWTAGGTVTLNSQVFDAGSGTAEIDTTGAYQGLIIKVTNDGASGATLDLRQVSANPATDDSIARLRFSGKDSVGNDQYYGSMQCDIVDPTSDSEDVKILWELMNGGVANEAMTLSGAGELILDKMVSFDQDVDSAAVVDTVSLGGYEISAGHRALAISSEEVVVAEADESKFSHKLPVRINGATYNMMLCAT